MSLDNYDEIIEDLTNVLNQQKLPRKIDFPESVAETSASLFSKARPQESSAFEEEKKETLEKKIVGEL